MTDEIWTCYLGAPYDAPLSAVGAHLIQGFAHELDLQLAKGFEVAGQGSFERRDDFLMNQSVYVFTIKIRPIKSPGEIWYASTGTGIGTYWPT